MKVYNRYKLTPTKHKLMFVCGLCELRLCVGLICVLMQLYCYISILNLGGGGGGGGGGRHADG